MSLHIRPAQPADAAFAAPLIQSAIGAIGHHLTGSTNDHDAAQVLARFFARPGHRLSFTQTLVAELDGRPVGLAVLYPGAEAGALDEPFRAQRQMLGLDPQIVSEGRPGELYLDTLATVPEVRGQGIGGQLLDACAERARALGLPLSLLVEDGNPAARLYLRSGFSEVGREEIAGHGYARLWRGGSESLVLH